MISEAKFFYLNTIRKSGYFLTARSQLQNILIFQSLYKLNRLYPRKHLCPYEGNNIFWK